QILAAIEAGDPQAAAQLLPLVYDELRRLAAAQLAQERPGQTLDATALVHEAWLRLAPAKRHAAFDNPRYFFAAAPQAMRGILVESARRKRRLKRGGQVQRRELADDLLALPEPREDLLALDEGLTKLAAADPQAAELIQLRYFAGLTLTEA